ncbi:hypothetical protein KQI42_03995 [Tissierella sp. MSJ-40]|uniref:Short-chain dehydrogenase n=1 Tax=Tissierella simiarum TaxID=2841534 RepID=A0ABS6E2Q0_9FIRM|nr:hypothetical protein [Tissierella simiarum]MBU5437158.1 hypothetical protein [Tissierella simiarum]
MPYIHEFGIIDCIEKNKDYDFYEPEKYNCISVDGDLIDEIYYKGFGDKMKNLETFAHNTNRPYKDLAYYGVTLIPPKSLKQFLNIIIEENAKYKSKELKELTKKICDAIKENKWLIHFGI